MITETRPPQGAPEGAGDLELLTSGVPVPWRRSAPARLRAAFDEADLAGLGRELRTCRPYRQLARSKRGSARTPVCWQPLWSRFAFAGSERSRRLAERIQATSFPLETLSRKRQAVAVQELETLFDEFNSSAAPSPDSFELVCWLSLLFEPQLPDALFARIWLRLWQWVQPVWQQTGWDSDARLSDDQRVVMTGELPWLCSRVFSELRGARRLGERGVETLRAELLAGCDDDGAPHAALLERLPLWLAPFVRTAGLAQRLDDPWWDKRTRIRFERLVRRVAALTRSTGDVALTNGAVFSPGSLIRSAGEIAGLGSEELAGRFLAQLSDVSLPVAVRPQRRKAPARPSGKRKHRPSSQSDAARVACLRSNWDVGSDACVVAFDGVSPRIDLTAFGVPVLRGNWSAETTIAGTKLDSAADWECVCWFSDADADYMELKQAAPGGVEILRQMLLSRADHFLLLSDVVKRMAGGSDGIEHRMELPLVSGTSAEQDTLTREWKVRAGALKVRVLPLALPQEAVNRASGRLEVDNRAVRLVQQSQGAGLACPVLLDWSPTRRKAATQWRQLTVAENGVTLTGAESCGVRWRIGDDQWLYYHALTPRYTARTVLGFHTFHETVIGEVLDGEIEQLVQVEE